MSASEAAREVRSVYLADPGARDALRARWPLLATALDRLVAAGPGGLLGTREVDQISDRWRTGPWAAPPQSRG